MRADGGSDEDGAEDDDDNDKDNKRKAKVIDKEARGFHCSLNVY